MTPTHPLPPTWQVNVTGGSAAGQRCGRPRPGFRAGVLRPALLDVCAQVMHRRNGVVVCPRCGRGPD